MKNAISLRELVEEMDTQSEDDKSFINRETGKIIIIETSILRRIEEEEIEAETNVGGESLYIEALDIIENDEKYEVIPSQWDINEYEMMEDFISSMESPKVRDRLYGVIKGKGAFRRFKDMIIKLDVEQQWYLYKDQRLKEIAIKFCEMYDINYIDDMK
ncbi:UPF0158 family protein [Sutcliffiella cohnii]|uniref:Uncharacterized protein n=1 Tax=Sutcliffiella cohnii TaxID=33932 RepID=A0A223KN74_9BACI|nr:UPF0158 family protein [Sutcliffiella cohnii]AST90846.1 hypothetical protein BC6307_05875 [Sutcliffiella cohnii]MED4017866.1 UPF0158 family protein [Sutcliffiella cohnii]